MAASMKHLFVALIALCVAGQAIADSPVPSRRVQFSTDEGTWMSLDVSPDARTIVFELVGDLYSMPLAGGKAQRLTSGTAFDSQPRYSPDGNSIAFVSDRSGADNIWVMDVRSGEVRALTQESGAFFVSPEWTPDGQEIVVTRSTKNVSHGRHYQLFIYSATGGAGRQLTGGVPELKGTIISQGVLGAAFGTDPQRIFAAVQVKPKWPSFATWQIAAIDRSTGFAAPFTEELNSAVRPLLSPDGRSVVYATRWENQSRLKLVDLQTRESRWLVSDIDRSTQEVAPRRDLLPGAAFLPDSSALIMTHHGKFWRINVPDGAATAIPFTADVDVQLAPLAQFDYPIDEQHVTARRIEAPQLSPDGRWLAFSALGRVYVQAATFDGRTTAPRQVSAGADGAFFPVWSPDGRYLAYVTWNDSEGGGVWRVQPRAGSAPERISTAPDFYEKLAYSPDGQRIVAARSLLAKRFSFYNENQGIGRGNSRELVWLPANGGAATLITNINPVTYWGASSHYGRPHFVTGDAEQVYFTDPVDGLVSVRWDGSQRRSVLRIEGPGFAKPELATEVLLSPDAKQVLALLNNQVWLADMPANQAATPTIALPADGTATPLRRLSRDGGDFPQWSADGRSVSWSLGSTLFRQLTNVSSPRDPQRQEVVLRVARDVPRGLIVLRGARVITMRGDEVIENADVVVTDNRITAVGPQGSVRVPAKARVIDVSGKTILPGYVDVHWHGSPPWGVHRTHLWEFQVNLAYGVTSTRDPQPAGMDALTYSDRISSGAVLGPRHFTTGRGVFIQDDIRSLDDARAIARRYAQFYRTETLKDYITNADRQTMQWLAAASREYRLTPTAEGNSDFKSSLTRILDGYAGQEHMTTATNYYRDLTQLIAASGTTITPTLLEGQTGGQDRLEQFVYAHDLYRDPKIRRFFPAEEIEFLSVGASTGPLQARYSTEELVSQPRAVLAAGGRIALGVHGAMQGLGAHWALWTFVDGGISPHAALRAGTLTGAEAIGHGKNFGSIEVGKLADLQVLDRNPLDDIRNTLALRYVMINGRLFETDTLDQVWPEAKRMGPQWWQVRGE
ncbi:amidohydrolase family protein [Steroidobacter sp.]|uniref:amidohydrolase family protein n=1 Tax=Steroidobacter sp. TaxID=1978227 RepID=UPI001A4B2043|nr:amidohydrolase family protein [Steroidobacter sp.]MBL8265902.1 PD40 domain-containing protein [Steroidobacter sp.]